MQALHFDVVFEVSQVAQDARVSEVNLVLQSERNAGKVAGDLPGDEGFAAHRAFVVEQDAIAGIDTLAFHSGKFFKEIGVGESFTVDHQIDVAGGANFLAIGP